MRQTGPQTTKSCNMRQSIAICDKLKLDATNWTTNDKVLQYATKYSYMRQTQAGCDKLLLHTTNSSYMLQHKPLSTIDMQQVLDQTFILVCFFFICNHIFNKKQQSKIVKEQQIDKNEKNALSDNKVASMLPYLSCCYSYNRKSITSTIVTKDQSSRFSTILINRCNMSNSS